ncbi:hypothetical protein [Pontibacter sp. G13]|uniref:hypothetical protein n=1 Tax=Pontibacter sp. G13 TaxID=3074898 RepID=UPI00288A2966|nr:hypothetical protein [Pontibacter sp. G13]WNJ19643.1 hypothetical protein RJD25_04085 [Pontibacter sp. G13]
MSNLSDIGFPVESHEEFLELINQAYERGKSIEAEMGQYIQYEDASGAELWLQINQAEELIGMNPHFNGKSRRWVCITGPVNRPESELDGAFHGWAAPEFPNRPETGMYPFVFDVPNFYTMGEFDFPKSHLVQLTAFAQEITLYDKESDFLDSQPEDFPMSAQSFIPSGLFDLGEQGPKEPQALGILSGVIKQHEKLTSTLKKGAFHWMLVETLGGEVDVVTDASLCNKAPKEGGIVHGNFWLSGKIIGAPKYRKVVWTNWL